MVGFWSFLCKLWLHLLVSAHSCTSVHYYVTGGLVAWILLKYFRSAANASTFPVYVTGCCVGIRAESLGQTISLVVGFWSFLCKFWLHLLFSVHSCPSVHYYVTGVLVAWILLKYFNSVAFTFTWGCKVKGRHKNRVKKSIKWMEVCRDWGVDIVDS